MQPRNPFIPQCAKLKLIEIVTDLSKGSGNEVEGSRNGSFKVTASNQIITWVDISNNKQYSANGTIFIQER
jgi:hypothetical protein